MAHILHAFNTYGNHLYIDRHGRLETEEKKKGVIDTLTSSFLVLVGAREYRLSEIVKKLFVLGVKAGDNRHEMTPLLKKTFKALHFTDRESKMLRALLRGNKVMISSENGEIDLKAFNRKINGSKELKQIFAAAGASIAFEELRKHTYKAALFSRYADPRFMGLLENQLTGDRSQKLSKSDVYLIDKFADFHGQLSKGLEILSNVVSGLMRRTLIFRKLSGLFYLFSIFKNDPFNHFNNECRAA